MTGRVYSTKTKKIRKIPVRPEVAKLTRELMKAAPRGSHRPLFRNTKGDPWLRMTGAVRFLNLKKKLGWNQDPVRKHYFVLHLSTHVRASDALGLLDPRGRLLNRNTRRIDR